MIVILLFVALLSPNTQRNVDTARLKLQAQELSDATLNGDYARAADLTFPKLVTLLGGRAKYIANLKKGMAEMDTPQFKITSITVGEPQDIFEASQKHYAIVPTIMRMKVAEGILVGESYMIGISNDGGRNWTFVDPGDRPSAKEAFRTLFGAAAADQLRIPQIKRPVLYSGPNPLGTW